MDSKRIQDFINSLVDKYATNETHDEICAMIDYYLNQYIDECKEQEAYEQPTYELWNGEEE
jgi:hypothetical protein